MKKYLNYLFFVALICCVYVLGYLTLIFIKIIPNNTGVQSFDSIFLAFLYLVAVIIWICVIKIAFKKGQE